MRCQAGGGARGVGEFRDCHNFGGFMLPCHAVDANQISSFLRAFYGNQSENRQKAKCFVGGKREREGVRGRLCVSGKPGELKTQGGKSEATWRRKNEEIN